MSGGIGRKRASPTSLYPARSAGSIVVNISHSSLRSGICGWVNSIHCG
ncbi:MAG: hypothetical protein ACLTZF_14060 [Oscillospiraceae bacterium]